MIKASIKKLHLQRKMFRGNHKLLMIKDAFRSIFASRFGLKNMKVPFVGEIFEFFFLEQK